MRHPRINTDLFRTLVLTLLAALAAVTVAMANRNVYTMDQVDAKLESIQCVEDLRHQNLYDDVTEIKDNVQWITREMGRHDDTE